MNVKGRQAENSAATRTALLKIARKLFAERGYAETATEEVVRRARVTRGALYHHFHNKQDLFKAVLHEEERRLAGTVATAALAQPDPWRALKAGSEAFLDACLEPAVRQIVLIDAPAVLGWEAYREIDASYFLAGVKASIGAAIEAKLIPKQPIDALGHLLMGALHEASLMIAHSKDQSITRREVSETVERLFNGIRESSSKFEV
jgi:AcrR family transcriptional regulator